MYVTIFWEIFWCETNNMDREPQLDDALIVHVIHIKEFDVDFS